MLDKEQKRWSHDPERSRYYGCWDLISSYQLQRPKDTWTAYGSGRAEQFGYQEEYTNYLFVDYSVSDVVLVCEHDFI